MLEGQIRGWLEANGWEAGRETSARRRRGYKQPAVWPPKIEDEGLPDDSGKDQPGQPQAHSKEGDDDEPF